MAFVDEIFNDVDKFVTDLTAKIKSKTKQSGDTNHILSESYSAYQKCFEDGIIDVRALRKIFLRDLETSNQELLKLDESIRFEMSKIMSSLEDKKDEMEKQLKEYQIERFQMSKSMSRLKKKRDELEKELKKYQIQPDKLYFNNEIETDLWRECMLLFDFKRFEDNKIVPIKPELQQNGGMKYYPPFPPLKSKLVQALFLSFFGDNR